MSLSTNEPASSGPTETTVEDVKIFNDKPPENAVAAVKKRKEPPPEKPENARMRIQVLISFWAIILLLGVPIWWRTTTIYRAPLPLDQMTDWAEGRVCQCHIHE